MRDSWNPESADKRSAPRLLATLTAVSGAAVLLAIAVAVVGALLSLATGRAYAQTISQPVPLPLLPGSVAFDAAGNLYFADTNRHVVYESSLAGQLSIIAGDGMQGFGGDGGPATSAELNSPQGVAIGPDGTLYIADTGNQRVRAVAGGGISTFAGNGTAGFSGDGGLATSAAFRGPNALAIDTNGALLVCDAGNQRVRRISATIIQTVIGNGLQGFAGDGSTATTAELDTPMGLSVSADGRIFVADSHNQRIRVIAPNGFISTFAGTGQAGYSGDGGPATSAQLSLPRGLMVTAAGNVFFADSNNQRMRMVAASGTITTIAGTGLQGTATDGAPAMALAMNSPRAVSVSSFGAPVYADALNHLVRESLVNGNVYTPAGLAPSRQSSVTLSATSNNGQIAATASVEGSTSIPQGTVALFDGATVLTQTTLVSGIATFATQTLSPGTHSLSASYLGDGVNPASTSAALLLGTGTGVITASATPATIAYGQPIPLLAGSIQGAPSQGVTVTFTTTAILLSAVGSYPIAATLSGPASASFTVVMSSASGSLQIRQAASLATEQPPAQNSYAGLPLLLSANVASTTEGLPTGTVTFLDNGVAVASASLIGGTAMGTYLAPGAGTHSLVASYTGSSNFLPTVSQPATTTVSAIPDFSLATSGSTKQTVAAGTVANYGLTVVSQSGSFTGVVDFSASGLPPDAALSFSPPQVVPGAQSVSVTMSIQTSAMLLTRTSACRGGLTFAGLFFPLGLFAIRRRRTRRCLALGSFALLMPFLSGCGARTLSTPLQGEITYNLTVTATSTNLAGAIVSHSTPVTLVVE